MAALHDRIDAATLATMRRDLMARGQTLAILLADTIAGKDVESRVRALDPTPGIRPAEAIRLALDQVEARRALLDADDDRFGRCDICGAAISVPALQQMPWADRDPAHAGR